MVAWSFFEPISIRIVVVSKIIKNPNFVNVIKLYHWKGLVLLYGISAGFFSFSLLL